MFRETLLESAPFARRHKRWPMALAFAAELFAAGLLVMLPLLSTGVIAVSARIPLVAPLARVEIARPDSSPSVPAGRVSSAPLVPLANVQTRTAIPSVADRNLTDWTADQPAEIRAISSPSDFSLIASAAPSTRPAPTSRTVISSRMSEGLLLNRVQPVYPRLAILAGIEGEVKLHAVITTDGSIASLTVVSGHPVLVRAALEAVRQWRYRPYSLNGQPVEVETFIAVNFKKTKD